MMPQIHEKLSLLKDELNKYECEAFINAAGSIQFAYTPLDISFDGATYLVQTLYADHNISYRTTEPRQVVYFILKGLWKL